MNTDGTSRGAGPGVAFALGVALMLQPGAARSVEQTVNEFWPEINVYLKLDEQSRLLFLGSLTRAREFAASTDATYAVHYDWFGARLPDGWLQALPGAAQHWSVWFRFGYQFIDAIGSPSNENRLLTDMTVRSTPLVWGLQFANRNRIEYRAIDGDTSWRYRNRSRIERGFAPTEALGQRLGEPLASAGVGSLVPYAMLEFFYDTRVSAWNRRLQQYGVEFELRRDRAIELYVARQDQNRSSNSRVIAVGVVFTLRY